MSDTPKLTPPKLCGWCHEPFTPNRYKPGQGCCSPLCARKYGGLKRRGQQPPQLLGATQRRADARLAALIGDAFGMLSERERALVQLVKTRAYDRGYNAALAPSVKRVGQATQEAA